ncbi:MAG: endo alpha-1,4 polygalactosaminidase [Nitrospirae bacterium]|nr:endo alpha-1,4 polygalactosaminidase [Nitrospirota bacterium]
MGDERVTAQWGTGAGPVLTGAGVLLCVAFGLSAGGAALAQQAGVPWAVYYGAGASAAAFAPFDIVVLDSAYSAPVAPLRERGKTVLAYLSLGEVGSQRGYFQALRADGVLLGENPDWPGSFGIDVRDPRWQRRVVDELVPGILARGFDGLFIDTLDYPIERERAHPDTAAGMRAAAAELVLAIRRQFPKTRIMLNRAYAILPEVGGHIDMLLGESVFTRHDFGSGAYRRTDAVDFQRQVRELDAARRAFPNLRVMTLDYWDPADPAGIRAAYAEQRRHGFSPYVATIGLDRVVYEPAP